MEFFFSVPRYGFLVLLWIFVFTVVGVIRRDLFAGSRGSRIVAAPPGLGAPAPAGRPRPTPPAKAAPRPPPRRGCPGPRRPAGANPSWQGGASAHRDRRHPGRYADHAG